MLDVAHLHEEHLHSTGERTRTTRNQPVATSTIAVPLDASPGPALVIPAGLAPHHTYSVVPTILRPPTQAIWQVLK